MTLGMFLAIVLFLGIVQAAEPVSVEIVEDAGDVEAGSSAMFKIIITNNQDSRDVFKIVGDDFAVYPFSEFAALIKAEPAQVKLDAEESAEVIITIETLDTAKVNTRYTTKIKVSSLINPEQKTLFDLNTLVVSAKDVIEIIPLLPEKIKPGEEVRVPIKLKNRAYIPLTNLELYASSDVPEIAQKKTFNIKEREEVNETMNMLFGKNTLPGYHTLNIKVYQNDEIKGSFTQDVYILPRDDVTERIDIERGFLSWLTAITKKNEGNIASEQKVETHYTLWKRVFTTTQPKAKKEDGKYVWRFTLQPGEEAKIEILTNYRPVLYGIIIIAIFIAGMLWHIERSVVLKKRIFRVKEDTQGISEFKILLHLRNGSKGILRDVKVLDILPFVVSHTNDFGTLKPTTIQKGKKSVRMVWEIGDLQPKEERVLSYKVHSKMDLLGEVRLPAAIVQFLNKRGVLIELRSLKLRVIKKEE